MNLISRYSELAQKAQDAYSSYRRQVLATGRLFNDQGSSKTLNAEELINVVRERFPLLPAMPPDCEKRIRANHRSTHLSAWRKWIQGGL